MFNFWIKYYTQYILHNEKCFSNIGPPSSTWRIDTKMMLIMPIAAIKNCQIQMIWTTRKRCNRCIGRRLSLTNSDVSGFSNDDSSFTFSQSLLSAIYFRVTPSSFWRFWDELRRNNSVCGCSHRHRKRQCCLSQSTWSVVCLEQVEYINCVRTFKTPRFWQCIGVLCTLFFKVNVTVQNFTKIYGQVSSTQIRVWAEML